MSTNTSIYIPEASDAEGVLRVPVAGHPIEDALEVAADLAAGGEEDVARPAAAALWLVARDRPLDDGNKRASLALADLVLRVNGWHLSGSEEDLVQLAARTAAGVVDEEWTAGEVSRLAEIGAPEESFLDREPEVIRRLAEDEYVLPDVEEAWVPAALMRLRRLPLWRPRSRRAAAPARARCARLTE